MVKNVCITYHSDILLFKKKSCMPAYHCWHHSDVSVVDKTTVELVNNKISEISLKPYCVFFNDTISDRHASHRNGFRSTVGIHQKRSVASRFTWTMDYHVWGVMLQAYRKLHPKPKSNTKLKEALQMIRDSLPQEPINKVVKASHNDWRDAQKLTVNNSSTQNDCQTSHKLFTV